MTIYDVPLRTLDGEPTTLAEHRGKALLVVNVASFCGYTPQYAGLQRLHEEFGPRGFSVLGFPCNQFGAQEPGTSDEIKTFCETSYGVSFPLYEKVDVNGPDQHPLFAELTETPDPAGEAGDVKWNFEKFLLSPDGKPVGRFRTRTAPEDADLRAAVEDQLPS